MLAPKEDQRWSPAFRAAAHPTWFLRLDPDIERSYGRVDFAVDHHRGLVDELRAHGDPFGIHVHYHRWDERRQVVYSDHANVNCVSLDWATGWHLGSATLRAACRRAQP
jgi:hypothetical protein